MAVAPKRAAAYLRVSTGFQTTDNQILDLQKVANLSGWEIVEIYQDHGISGSKGRDKHTCRAQKPIRAL